MPALLSPTDPRPLEERAELYGCTNIIRLDEKLSAPAQLDYLDLLPKQSNHAPFVSAVAEHQGTALLYLIDATGDAKSDEKSLTALRRQLANRSDPAWLGVVKPGSLEIFTIGFHAADNAAPIKTIAATSATAPLFFQSLVHGTFEANDQLHGTDYVYRKIFDLLTQTTNEFVPRKGKPKVEPLEVLSMAGRALFFRFLIDRGIVLDGELHGPHGICMGATELKDAFSSAEKAAQTSAWLDETFNGDFLPLIDESTPARNRAALTAKYLKYYKDVESKVGKKIFNHLHAILRGWRAVGGGFQTELDWGDFDFAHIPVGVLSQVYESFSHRTDPRTAQETSVHYTPRTIASLMVDQSFAAVKDASTANVLDPACGAGIFLVLAFRRLVRERWVRNDERPTTALIQEILYQQVRGFDVSESALRLAALALYVTAIEVNGSPRPPHALKFPRNLRGEVLHRFSADEDSTKTNAFSLGSLGPEVSSDFDGTFDIVIGNPPWTRLRERKSVNDDEQPVPSPKSTTDELNREFTKIGRRVLKARGLTELAESYDNPDKNPDLPFLWRAMEWAKDKGVIALAMPARLFGRTSGKGFEAWCAVLRSVAITGLLNGADLRKTAVWEGVDMPFCLFFARNAVPKSDHRFQYATPLFEPESNGHGRFRIDYESAQPLSIARIEKQPWVLKALSLGTWLDVEVMDGLTCPTWKTLKTFWMERDARKLKTGKGYDRSPNHPQNPATFLGAMPDFIPEADEFGISWDDLKTYKENHGTNRAAWPRRETLYEAPLVILPQSPGDTDSAPRAFIARQNVAFSQSYYGYSCAGHPEAETLASFIYLLPHSTLFAYFCLMTSRRSGFDRQTFNKEEFDALPFVDIGKLDKAKKAEIRKLAHRLEHDRVKPWEELNSLVFRLYGLDDDAVQIAEDTLFSAVSYRKAGRAALDQTKRDTRTDFINTLCEELEPYFDVCGEQVAVREAEFQPDTWHEPWFFLAVSRRAATVPVNANLTRKAMEIANARGTSRIIVHAHGKRGLLLGLLNQRRWWTITRARLCAQHIIRSHLGACGLREGE